MKDLKDKKILVLGFARSGYATAKILKKLNYNVIVNAKEDLSENEQALELVHLGIDIISGSHPLELLEDIDIIVKNPGIPYDIEFLEKAMKKNIDIITEIELASTLFNVDIVAITGTNGKTTTTQMLYEILKEDNKDVHLAGNIGYPAIEVAYNNPNSILVMEVSSFQLQGTINFKPTISVITNLGVGHLNYHKTLENYQQAKKNIFRNQTEENYLILNIKEKEKYDLEKIKSTVLFYTTDNNEKLDIYVKDNKVIYKDIELFDSTKIKLPGSHNLENAIDAGVSAYLKGASLESIRKVLYSFSGVKHRLQYVGEISGVKYYNDSKATNPVATITALAGFKENIILICGGENRGVDFKELIPYLDRVKTMIVVGQSKEILYNLAINNNIKCIKATKVADATQKASEISQKNDIILLSPACSSWDQYKSFEVRGDEFISTFTNLKNKG